MVVVSGVDGDSKADFFLLLNPPELDRVIVRANLQTTDLPTDYLGI